MVRKSNNLAGHTRIPDDHLLEHNMPLYKYMKSDHAHSALRNGVFRIGTLLEFQDEERHGTEIGDRDEGTKRICNSPGEIYDYSIPGSAPGFAEKFIRVEEQYVTINGILMEETIASPNYYIYCVTSEISQAAMKEFECDTVIQIANPKSFFVALTESLSQQTEIQEDYNVVRCNYVDRRYHYSDNDRTHPATIKSHKYSYQKEVRAIWTPIHGNIEPIMIKNMSAASLCTVVNQI